MRAIILFVMVVGLVACAPQYKWYKSGATQADFRKDAYECERDMRQSGYFGTGIVGAMNAQNFGERCMESRGWEKRQESSSSAKPFHVNNNPLVECQIEGKGVITMTLEACGKQNGEIDY